MHFFVIIKYSGLNFNLVQENHFFAVITGIFESKTLAIITMHVFLKLRLTFNNFILKTAANSLARSFLKLNLRIPLINFE